MSNPDFIQLVETNRLRKNGSNTSTQKTSTRAYMNENITLRFEDGSTSSVPRFRLDKEFVQNAVNRFTAKNAQSKSKVFKSHLFSAKDTTKGATTNLSSRPPALIFSHLYHRDSNTIIMSDTALKAKCSANVTYDVVAMAAIAIKDGGVLSGGGSRSSRSLSIKPPTTTTRHIESHYDGNILFVIHDVPTTSQNDTYEVTENDVRRWLVTGTIRNTETVDVLSKKIESLKQTLLQIEQEIASLPPISIPSGGKGRVGSSAQNVRDKKAKILSDERERCTSLMQTATQSLETLHAQHMKDCVLVVEKRSRENDFDSKTCDWAILVDGDNKEMYTSLIEKNKNWSMIPMYAFDAEPISLPISEKDQSRHFVDVGGIRMSKLPHRFGIFESYEEFDPYLTSGKTRSRHCLYHGQFHEGEFSEGTLYTEAGAYAGKFKRGEQTVGTMECVDGIKISGDFAVDDVSLQTRRNPYSRGLPDGLQIIKFPDKATYEGEMKQGCITGKGNYNHAGLELLGEFKDGVLQVDGGDEGQGYSNLHLSCMYDGERLWGLSSTKQKHKS